MITPYYQSPEMIESRIGNGMLESFYPEKAQEQDDPSWDEVEYKTEEEREAAEDRKHFEDGFPMLFG